MSRRLSLTGLSAEERGLVHAFEEAGQGHLFRFWPELEPPQRSALVRDLAGIDLGLLDRLLRDVLEGRKDAPRLTPLEAFTRDGPGHEAACEAAALAFSRGEVAFYTVAGGQGTRLGFPGPKGCFPIGPYSGKSLFHWHAEKVLAASRRFGPEIPWVILVSATNEEETRRFFEENSWFGLTGRVFFVTQRMMPAVDDEGRILLRSRHRVALSPNGHGGSMDALVRDGTLSSLEERGIRWISYFQVDNATLNPADLAFLGHHIREDAEFSVKVFEKLEPGEKAGVVAAVDGVPGVVEYSELPDELARARDADGRLSYRHANLAAHVISVPFVRRIVEEGLPFHRARKSVPTVGPAGEPFLVTGSKFETFIFDAMPLANGFTVFHTDRYEEYSPLKNAEGAHSPARVKTELFERSRAWFLRAGEPVPEESALEISPLMAYDYDSFTIWLTRRRA